MGPSILRNPTQNVLLSGGARFKCECQEPLRKFKGSLATLMEDPLSTLPFYLMVQQRNGTQSKAIGRGQSKTTGFEISLEISQCDWIRLSADFASTLMSRPLTAITTINLKVPSRLIWHSLLVLQNHLVSEKRRSGNAMVIG